MHDDTLTLLTFTNYLLWLVKTRDALPKTLISTLISLPIVIESTVTRNFKNLFKISNLKQYFRGGFTPKYNNVMYNLSLPLKWAVSWLCESKYEWGQIYVIHGLDSQ